ncbi:T9SS type A sorting domain-containing protein [Brumimicrobium oceani]|uniref:Secretion system C-terminal sorting domain-containing protein n=1 Tax=Brumimicrobium oceani TaxID=2100725 RepID=A0A2U2XCW4_9FLAO|nr:T9SS type A sorting domain-containing protein [Brumimicrobium oceani]PWH85635.1 hypothetical protein DIT68_08335 [Brumimicrobium oceani]
MIRLTFLFCLFATVGEAQFTPVFEIPSNYSGFDIEAFEMNDNGDMMLITEPYNGGPTINKMVYTSTDFGQSWDSTLFLNQSMMRDNACVTDGGNLYFTTLISVPSTTNPPGYIKRVLHSSQDNGVTWLESEIDSIDGSLRDRSLSFINDSTGMFFYQQGMYFTNDYGQNWQHVDTIYPNSLGFLEDRFVYHGNLNLYTYDPISGNRQAQPFDPLCEGFVYQVEFHNDILYSALRAWNGHDLGPPYNGNFASLNMDALPLGAQNAIHFPQRYAFIDLSITNSCIHIVLDGRYVRSCDGGETFYDVDAFNGNINENVRFMEFVNDSVGYLVSQNLITYDWHLWETTNGGGVNGAQVLTNTLTANLVEENQNLSFELYPNPSKNTVNIVSSELIRELVVYSMDGKLVASQKVNSKTTTIDISSFPKGNYVVKVATENSIGHSKIVKL